jgi:glutathione synthase/RimK-type ligase-like ATP-grasp enzyme
LLIQKLEADTCSFSATMFYFFNTISESKAPMRLHLVDDGVPSISKNTILEACKKRDLDTIVHKAASFVFEPERKSQSGDLLFRPAISSAAMRVEQYLFQPDVATFYSEPFGIYFNNNNATFLYEQNDIPIPRTFYLHNTNRDAIDYYVEQLGGYPVILKVLGHSGGVGVMKLDNTESLYSVIDFVCVNGTAPLLCAFITDAVHWRCVVVGQEVVAAYINPKDKYDFRTYGTTDINEIFSNASREIDELSVKAVTVLGNEFGGVDVLQHPSGRCYVLEANFPCYYAHAQKIGGIDVAGKMIDYLLKKQSSFTQLT